MVSFSPPYPYFTGIIYDSAYFDSSSSLTKAQANALYLKKSSPDTATAVETFNAGIITKGLLGDHAVLTATDLTTWNNFNVLFTDMTTVGTSYQLIGYAIIPTVGSIAFYPAIDNPIGLLGGYYNIQATFQLNLSGINGTSGRIAVGVTNNPATGDWLFDTNGNFNNNIYKTHVGTLANGDFPLVYTINFNAIYGGYLYFKYYIQLASATGSITVNYMITRIG